MAYKNTVAIIGANTTIGVAVAKSIVEDYRLLLMDASQPKLVSLQNDIWCAKPNAEVDILNCCKDASWEADIIVVAEETAELYNIAVKMKEVATCKTVLHFTTEASDTNNLQQFLPHSTVVTIVLPQPTTGANAKIEGSDKEAIDIAKSIVVALNNKMLPSGWYNQPANKS